MESGVAVPIEMGYGPLLLIDGGVVRFETEVESQQEVCEVESNAKAVGCGNLFVELIEFEHAAGLVGIVVDCPDVSGIDKQGPFEHPEKFRAIFGGKNH